MKKLFALSMLFFFAITLAVAQTVDPAAPPPFDPSTTSSWLASWTWWYTLTMPIGTWLLSYIWPSNTKQALTIKASSFAIMIVVVIVMYQGIDTKSILNAVLAFLMQAIAYDKILQPIGLDSKKDYK
jgi:hypothetical protein